MKFGAKELLSHSSHLVIYLPMPPLEFLPLNHVQLDCLTCFILAGAVTVGFVLASSLFLLLSLDSVTVIVLRLFFFLLELFQNSSHDSAAGDALVQSFVVLQFFCDFFTIVFGWMLCSAFFQMWIFCHTEVGVAIQTFKFHSCTPTVRAMWDWPFFHF